MTITALGLALVLSVQAPSDQGTAPVEPAVKTAQATDEVTCKKISVPGTRFKERICATADQWEKLRRKNIEITREFKQNDGSTKGG